MTTAACTMKWLADMHAILAERTAVTPEMAMRIGKLCGSVPSLCCGCNRLHDIYRLERDMADQVATIPTTRAKAA